MRTGVIIRQDQLDVAQAQTEYMIQPDDVADDLHRETVSGIVASSNGLRRYLP
jgi:hypothetical protein